jgi:CDP-6-deoxy-D-xylo-4-hexulose-3-dehydrase
VREGAGFDKKQLTDFLEKRGIETRPVMAGNLEEQPALRLIEHRTMGELPNAKEIMRRAFFWGNHPGVGERERAYIADTLQEFLEHRCSSQGTAEQSSSQR